jgi:hypothetical protein
VLPRRPSASINRPGPTAGNHRRQVVGLKTAVGRGSGAAVTFSKVDIAGDGIDVALKSR